MSGGARAVGASGNGIEWVFVSDLHLGAEASLLTAVGAAGETVAERPAPVAVALAAALRTLVSGQERLPRLVLLGDVLELALTSTERTLQAFEQLLRVVVGDDPVVDPEIWYVPGNHDHHVWEVAREEVYASVVEQFAPSTVLPEQWHVSAMNVTDVDPSTLPVRGRPVSPRLLEAVAARVGGARIRVVYPNLALPVTDGRAVIGHHGHFTEPLYTLMTAARRLVFPESAAEQAASVRRFWQMEEDNGAWIDFVWSALGRSGRAGHAVGTGFEMLGDQAASQALVEAVAGRLLESVAKRSGWPAVVARSGGPPTRAALGALVRRAGIRERFAVGGPLNQRVRSGIVDYVGGPLLAQYREEAGTARSRVGVEEELTFVFGHTHKPLASTLAVPGWEQPVRVLNTGGWVVDGTRPHPMIGGGVVLVDGERNGCLLDLVTQSDNPANRRVVLDAPEADPADNPLWTRLDRSIDLDAPVWRHLVDVGRSEVELRRRQARERLAAGVVALRRT